jgi:hypothetical protein
VIFERVHPFVVGGRREGAGGIRGGGEGVVGGDGASSGRGEGEDALGAAIGGARGDEGGHVTEASGVAKTEEGRGVGDRVRDTTVG